jgi:hypothetical protein
MLNTADHFTDPNEKLVAVIAIELGEEWLSCAKAV